MKRFFAPRSLRAALVAVIGITLTSAVPQSSPVAGAYRAVETTSDVDITARDVALSNQKLRRAHSALVSMWSSRVGKLGHGFYAPDIARIVHGGRTRCGTMIANNIIYCPRDNTIYSDEVFMPSHAKLRSLRLGTDRDMASLRSIPHGMGQAVA